MPLPFEFVIDGPPVSQQARRQGLVREWKNQIRAVAGRHWPSGESPVTEPVMLTITYFYDRVSMDVDNIPKPILDALEDLVYIDDEQVTDILCQKRNRNSDFRVENPSSILADGLSRDNEFLYIVVTEAPDQEVI